MAATRKLPEPTLSSDATETTELRRQLRHLSLALFLTLSFAVIAGLVALLRFVDLRTLLQAAVVVGGAYWWPACTHSSLIGDTRSGRCVAAGGAGAIAAVDQLLAAVK